MEDIFKDKEEAYNKGFLDGKRECNHKWSMAILQLYKEEAFN